MAASRYTILSLGVVNFVLVLIGSAAVLTIVFTRTDNSTDQVWMWVFSLFTFASSMGAIFSYGSFFIDSLWMVLFVDIVLNAIGWGLRLAFVIVPCFREEDYPQHLCYTHMWIHLLIEVTSFFIIVLDIVGIVKSREVHLQRMKKIGADEGSYDSLRHVVRIGHKMTY